MSLNIGQGQGYENYFGPASEPVDIAQFLSSTAEFQQGSSSAGTSLENDKARKIQAEWAAIQEETRSQIETECRYVLSPYPFQHKVLKQSIVVSVDAFRDQLHTVTQNPRLTAHVTQSYQDGVHTILEHASNTSKRKRKRTALQEAYINSTDVQALQEQLDNVPLESWP